MKYVAAAIVVVALVAAMVVSDIPAVGMAAADRRAYSLTATWALVLFLAALLFGGSDDRRS